jgi:hypothetical protein
MSEVSERWDFFISYTQADRRWAEWIAWDLEEAGYRVLLQAWDFAPGSNWVSALSEGPHHSARTIAVLSDSYLGSVYGQAEWQAAWAADPSGSDRRLLVVRVSDCDRPGLLAGVVGTDLLGLPEDQARNRLRTLISAARVGRAKPKTPPTFPGAPDSAETPPFPGLVPPSPEEERRPSVTPPAAPQRWDVAEVFQPTGVPEVTFVQPERFAEFLMALRQPGLCIILEGPSGAGKTTLLQHAIKQAGENIGQPRRLTARDPADIAAITGLVGGDNHQGLVAIDDFHRLPADLQAQVVDHLKLLADRGDRTRKLIIVGIPRTAQSLVRVSFDVANRIRIFQPGWAPDEQILDLIQQGEKALNIEFDDKPALVKAAAGSLITAQALCWHLMGLARIEETLPDGAVVATDIEQARERVIRELRLKYHDAVAEFTSLDDQTEAACIDLLLALAAQPDGVLYLDAYADQHPGTAVVIEKALAGEHGQPGAASEAIGRVVYHDAKARRLIADDPQFVFYIRHLDREKLMQEAGWLGRLPVAPPGRFEAAPPCPRGRHVG